MTIQDALALTEGQTVLNINKEAVEVVGVEQKAPGLVLVTVKDQFSPGTWVIPHSGISYPQTIVQ